MKPELLSYTEAQDLHNKDTNIELRTISSAYGEELFDIQFPSKKDTKTSKELIDFERQLLGSEANSWGKWVYYPWLNLCIQIPPKHELRILRTSRNRNLINSEEQSKLYDSTIFIAGMSVGSNVVEALVSQGIGGKLILADMDTIEPSNLNRIRSPLHHVGLHKVDAISRKVWEMDPYVEIIALNKGISKEVIEDIFSQEKVDIIVDEMDALDMKIALREKAKQIKAPVIMAADDGDNSLIDIERYDKTPDMELFNGLIPEHVVEKVKQGSIPRRELGMLIGKYFVGPEHIPLRMFESVAEVGITLPSWPQLGGAAALSGVALAYAAKKIILGQYLKEGRTLISLDDSLSVVSSDEKKKLDKYKQSMLEG